MCCSQCRLDADAEQPFYLCAECKSAPLPHAITPRRLQLPVSNVLEVCTAWLRPATHVCQQQGGEDELKRIISIMLSFESRMTPAALLYVYSKALHALTTAGVVLPVQAHSRCRHHITIHRA